MCVDDGGGTKVDQTLLKVQNCNPSNNNQLFAYDNSTSQVKSNAKTNLCI